MFRRYTVLRAPEGEEGSGSGEGQPKGSNGQGGAESVTPELQKFVHDTVGKAMSARFREFEGKQTKTLEGFKTDLTKAVGETLEEKLEALKPKEGDGKDKKPAGDDATQAEMKALRKANEDLKKRLDTADAEKLAQRVKTRDGELRKQLTDRLLAEGVDPKRVKHAAGVLIDVDELVGYENDDSDVIVFRETDGVNTLESGVKSWVASEDGKSWLPPRNANGSGDGPTGGNGARRPGTPPQQSQQVSKKELGAAILRHAMPGGNANQ